jgi:hypothetical protein
VAGWYVDATGNLQGVRDGFEGRVFGTSDSLSTQTDAAWPGILLLESDRSCRSKSQA